MSGVDFSKALFLLAGLSRDWFCLLTAAEVAGICFFAFLCAWTDLGAGFGLPEDVVLLAEDLDAFEAFEAPDWVLDALDLDALDCVLVLVVDGGVLFFLVLAFRASTSLFFLVKSSRVR
jgi:hypothetical protein